MVAPWKMKKTEDVCVCVCVLVKSLTMLFEFSSICILLGEGKH